MKARTSTPNMMPMSSRYVKAKELYDEYNEFLNENLGSKLEFNIRGLPMKLRKANLPYYNNILPYFKKRGILRKHKNVRSIYYFCAEFRTDDFKIHIPYKIFEEFLEERSEKNKKWYKTHKPVHENKQVNDEDLLRQTRNLAYIALGISILVLLLKLIF